MDSIDSKEKPSVKPSITIQLPQTVIQVSQNHIQEALSNANRHLAEEDFQQALREVDTVLKTNPDLESALLLRHQIQEAASRQADEIFNQGIAAYTECDWDSAIAIWTKELNVIPDDPAALEWIDKAKRRKNQEQIVRGGLLKELEQCGKLLSEKNYVATEEYLDQLKNRFTQSYRLTDLQRIYQELVIRTRVELEKEFEELRSNVIETAPEERPVINAEQQQIESAVNHKYIEAFQAGKKFFEKQQWQKALIQWERARELNPNDKNLIHWISLAENNLLQTPQKKPSPVRSTFAFLSVFTVTALITYYAYIKYSDYVRQVQNKVLIQRAIEHYRAGHLEESWKMLQLYLVQSPEDESARTLLERITFELGARKNGRQKENRIAIQLEVVKYLYEQNQMESAALVLNRILAEHPGHQEAKQLLARIR
jgi:tetratricopeptide (TPR) repeat protein